MNEEPARVVVVTIGPGWKCLGGLALFPCFLEFLAPESDLTSLGCLFFRCTSCELPVSWAALGEEG